jgi:hypothetical protein
MVWQWRVLSGVAALVLASAPACGGSTEDTRTATAGAAGAGSGGASSGGAGGASGSAGSTGPGGVGGFAIPDGGGFPDGFLDGAVLGEGGLFDCGGCACDGATHFCLHVAAGAIGAPPPPDAPACDDAGAKGCQPLPASCGNSPSCGCLPSPYGGACTCSDVGGGLEVFCALP